MFLKHIYPFFSPEDVLDKAAEVIEKPVGKQPKSDDDTALIDEFIGDKDLIDLDEQDKEDEKEPEEDLVEEDKEDDLIEDTNTRAIDLKKVKEKYPDFAKTNEFKELRNAYHREAQYTELFPTIEDAREAAENNETFSVLNDALVNRGDPAPLLEAVKNANPESFKKLTTSFLDAVGKMDNATYVEVISPVVRRLAKQIYDSGKKILSRDAEANEGKALVATARNIMQFAFDDADEINKEEPRPDIRISEKEKELSQREQNIARERWESAYKVADSSVERNLDKQILDGLDPDGKLNEFTRDTLLEKIKNEIHGQISRDTTHVKRMTSLWKRAMADGYSRESLSRIVSAYLERARPIIPTVRNKFRSIAIKGRTTDNDSEDKGIRIPNRGRTGRAPERDGKVNMRSVDSKKIDYNKTSDEDIFEGKVSLKGK